MQRTLVLLNQRRLVFGCGTKDGWVFTVEPKTIGVVTESKTVGSVAEPTTTGLVAEATALAPERQIYNSNKFKNAHINVVIIYMLKFDSFKHIYIDSKCICIDL